MHRGSDQEICGQKGYKGTKWWSDLNPYLPKAWYQYVGKDVMNPNLFFLTPFFPFLGSGPDRGRSPVEWGDFPSVRSFVRPFPPLGHPARPEAQPARPEAQPAIPEA